ncbi:amidase [Gemmata sp.]|uniref:amidase n=1 Tax=Gemmata sp. TaxID=1914242 RepID=UPI003F6E8223
MPASDVSRRELFAAAAALGVGDVTFQRAVAASAAGQLESETITAEMVKNAAWVAGITLTDNECTAVAARLTIVHMQLAAVRKAPVGYDAAPPLHFNPTPDQPVTKADRGTVAPTPLKGEVARPEPDDLAFAPLHVLAELLRTKKVSAVELAKLSLGRLKKYNPALLCAVTITEELALKQAAEADTEIAAGKYRGPLHGVPWVAKDLIAYPGYKTTWGAGHFKDQEFPTRATVAERLDAAGAVLVAKSTLGALAWGDQWFGGTTRNPWNVKSGSSGSSAGTASAVAAGLVSFGLGSETLGSIVSPSHTCGVTGLRPTFGRVSRHGCMALCWSLDKIGPMARSAEDCALVLGAIHGTDGRDASVQDRPFHWPATRPLKDLLVGYQEQKDRAPVADVKALEGLGVKLVPVTLPHAEAQALITIILEVEAAAAFDDLTREGVRADIGLWPNTFRRARFVSAVDYLRAQRARTLVMRQMAKATADIDVYVGPAGFDLALTNATGHPTVCVPNGFRKDGTPTGLTFTGRLFGETDLLALASAYQAATGHHLRRPPEDTWVPIEKK